VACSVAYTWIGLHQWNKTTETNRHIPVCLIKEVSNVPCPSCGSTRSITALISADFYTALITNPIGYIIAVILIVTPPWIIFDFVTSRSTFHSAFKSVETWLQRRQVAFIFWTLVLLNWIWNIQKEL
jgi:hypothetical protein